MSIKQKKIFYAIFCVVFLSSCVPRKELIYFQNSNDEIIKKDNFTIKYKKNDELRIDVSSSDAEAVKPFNLSIVSYAAATGAAGGQALQQTFFIDNSGEINFPLLGKIKLEGLEWSEAIDLLTEKLKVYVKDVTININIMNFRVNVLGDVRNPGSYLIPNGRISILDAIALAGDLNITGVRTIEIKRETKDGIISGTLDLKSPDLFASPFYYLRQNDVVYILPNGPKSQSASFNENASVLISTVSLIISLLAIFTR